MPTTIVASLILMNRKGINEKDLLKKALWLGQTLKKRKIFIQSQGLPTKSTIQVGLEHLKDYLENKRGSYQPNITPQVDYSNYIMLWYYRNPLNFAFFNEAVVIASLFSFGDEQAWTTGVEKAPLFEKVMFLSKLLKRETVLKDRVHDQQVFEYVLGFMKSEGTLLETDGKFILNGENETQVLFPVSILWPIIDTYYLSALFLVSIQKESELDKVEILKKIQWMGEQLFEDRTIQYFESCNQDSIKNAVEEF